MIGRLRHVDPLPPLLALAAAFALGAAVLAALQVNPLQAYAAMASGAATSWTQCLAKATPLMLVGLGIILAFRAGVFNIGAEGQLVVGALAATAAATSMPQAPAFILIPWTLLAGTAAGAAWAAVPGTLKARLGTNEILSTVMMNQIALQLMNYLLRGPMMDPAQMAAGTHIAQSAALPEAAWLPRLVPRSLLSAGFILALALAAVVYVYLTRTTSGFRLRAVGANPEAARYAGCNVPLMLAMALVMSGALAGLAGAVEVSGVHHRAVEGMSGGYGFTGIVAALFGRLHPLLLVPASCLFGALLVGADSMQRAVQVPTSLAVLLQGLVVLALVCSDVWSRRRRDVRLKESLA
jgi:ABC-type uncharacterized transport system permease subunit